MIDISIILPAWNASRTLERAILSAAKQTVGGVEVIVVDDGSTDETLHVAREAEAAGLCRTISIPHAGLGPARNAGIAEARGEYVTFLDADDAFTPDACERLLETAFAADADIVYGNHLYVTKEGILQPVLYLSWLRQLGSDENLRSAEQLALGHPVVTGSAYHMDLLRCHGLEFLAVAVAEDLEFSMRAWYRAERIHVAPGDVYIRRPFERAEGKSDRAASLIEIQDQLRVISLVNDFSAENGLLILQERNLATGLRRAMYMICGMDDASDKREAIRLFLDYSDRRLDGAERQVALLGMPVGELRDLSPELFTLPRALYWHLRADLNKR